MIINSKPKHRFSTLNIINLFFALLVLASAIGCDKGDRDEGEGEGDTKFTVVQEEGDASDSTATAQDITANPPFTIMGEIRGASDIDYYKFNGKANKTYVIGVTGNRTLTVDGQPATDGLSVYSPPRNGPVVICVSGGNPGAYVVTVFES